MEKTKEYTSPYEMDGRIPWPKAIVYGLQHVLAMFVGNLTPLIVICGACGIGAASDFAEVYVELLQNAMIIAGVVTLVQLFAIGPVGGRVPIIMGTSSGFIGVFKSVAGVMGGGVIAYGASLTQAAEVAERIRLKLNEKEMLIAKSTTIRISASLGVSSSEETGDYDFEQLQSLADRRLYLAKQAGRNRVFASDNA